MSPRRCTWRRRTVFSRHPKSLGVVKSSDKLCSRACRSSSLLAPVRECGLIPVSREEPSHEVHCGDGHANTEQDSGKDPLRPAFSKGKRQTRNHNRNEGKSPCDGAGKCL